MKNCYSLILFIFLGLNLAKGQDSEGLVHEFDFNGNLIDSKGTLIELRVHPDTITHGYGTSEWWWTATEEPGGGLVLETEYLTNPNSYSLGFRFKYDEIGSGYKKILSFKGKDEDNGLYFLDNNLVFYPFNENLDIEYNDSVYYDFIFSRSQDDTIKVYVVQQDGSITKIYEEFDELDASVPVLTGNSVQFMFFMDDEATGGEYTVGGAVKGIRLWDRPLRIDEIAGALSDAKTLDATNITSTSAVLKGSINPNKDTVSVDFEYGLSTEYGMFINASPGQISDSITVEVSAALSDLTPATTYHYRVRAISKTDTVYGSEKSFVTLVQYTLNYLTGDNGSISGNSNQTVDMGSDGNAVEAIPDNGYAFVKWSDESTDNPRTDTNVINNITVTAIFEAVVGNTERNSSEMIRLYPVPVVDILNIEVRNGSSFEITITDLSGRSIYRSGTVNHPFIRINFTELQSGVYIVRVNNLEGTIYHQKILKK